jgi:dTMP kinase
MLYEAARAQLTNEVIRPALHRGAIVVADRFGDSSVAYQGYGREIGAEAVRLANDVATGGLVPDLTFVVDVPIQVAFSRRGKDLDRIESEGADFHQRVREGFLALAKAEPERVVVIDGTRSIDDVFSQARDMLLARLSLGSPEGGAH